jgi:hypothetical protein
MSEKRWTLAEMGQARIEELKTELKNLNEFYDIEATLRLEWESKAKDLIDRNLQLERELDKAMELFKEVIDTVPSADIEDWLERTKGEI